MAIKLNNDEKWIKQAAEAETNGCVSVGGLYVKLGLIKGEQMQDFKVEFKGIGKTMFIKSQDATTADLWAEKQLAVPGFIKEADKDKKIRAVVTAITPEAKTETKPAEVPAKPMTIKDKKAAKANKAAKAKADRELERDAKAILAKAKKDEPKGQSMAKAFEKAVKPK